MDNLTRDSLAAQAAGMAYGKYMAQRQHNPPPPRKKVEEVPEGVPTRVCKHCGKVFSMEGRSHNSLYCSPECQRYHGQKIYLEKYHARRAAMKEDDDELEIRSHR